MIARRERLAGFSGATHDVLTVEIEGKRFVYIEFNGEEDEVELLKAILAATDLGMGLYIRSNGTPPNWLLKGLGGLEVRLDRGG